MKKKPKKSGSSKNRARRKSLFAGVVLCTLLAAHAALSVWFVHHPREWFAQAGKTWPECVTRSFYAVGNPIGDLTDALDLTGHDAVYEYDTEAPLGETLFAGEPRRTGSPAPDDITVIDRGPFKIGWSPRLRHPVWCAYHVRPGAKYPTSRKSFQRDREIPSSPNPSDYEHSGYDRGHMAPNYAIVTRYGEDAQKRTFRMTNISPQTPNLNRGVWCDLEHRIADLWTARYGEIWVIVGCIPSSAHKKIGPSSIDVPDAYYQIVVAQEGMDVRAFAVLLPQNVPWNAYAARNLITIDELEARTGLDFLPDLPSFIQTPLEADLPTRLWPIRFRDVFDLIRLDFAR